MVEEDDEDGDPYIYVYTFEVDGDNLNVTYNDGEIFNFTMTRVTDSTYDDLCN